MRVLLIWPLFPKTFWSFESVLELVGTRALVPPLGLATVAAILPQEWSYRIVDRNIEDITEEDWAWADFVMLSSMIIQKDDFHAIISEAKRRKKRVAVGGPYVTSVPDPAEESGADYIVQDEGEITIPMFLEAVTEDPDWQRAPGEPAKRFMANGQKPEMSETPVARFDLLDFTAYDVMAVQYSRGCPFLCEFCDIINLYGRKPRAKEPDQMLAEFDRLYELGWRGGVFLVDDNFIGNKKNVKRLLDKLRYWQHDHGVPYYLDTEASVDLAADAELLMLMRQCNFSSVFLGLETPDVESLALTRKHQNNRSSMADAVRTLGESGLRVMAGFIIGFDNEKPGAGDRIVQFIEQCKIPTAFLSMLQVLPNTGLYTRLEREGRLIDNMNGLDHTATMNFVPTRPAAEIAREYLDAYDKLYDPIGYLERIYRYYMEIGATEVEEVDYSGRPTPDPKRLTFREILKEVPVQLRMYKALFIILWRQGIVRKSRKVFWQRLFSMLWRRPDVFGQYVVMLAHNEHFLELSKLVRASIEPELANMPTKIYEPPPEPEAAGHRNKPVITSHLVVEDVAESA
ncbi:MAG: B12-binding domain-containing radical SAM protein [Alphaproteobacteria bacterium]|nr:B12-binding domain-containing radical SAM protein [Alphaproteobacteria bacterium]